MWSHGEQTQLVLMDFEIYWETKPDPNVPDDVLHKFMDISLAEGNKDAARSWLNMWSNVDEDNPDLLTWAMRIDGKDKLMQEFSKSFGRSCKPTKRRKQ